MIRIMQMLSILCKESKLDELWTYGINYVLKPCALRMFVKIYIFFVLFTTRSTSSNPEGVDLLDHHHSCGEHFP